MGNVTKDVSLNRIKDLLSFEIQSMIGKDKSETTKAVTVTVTIAEG